MSTSLHPKTEIQSVDTMGRQSIERSERPRIFWTSSAARRPGRPSAILTCVYVCMCMYIYTISYIYIIYNIIYIYIFICSIYTIQYKLERAVGMDMNRIRKPNPLLQAKSSLAPSCLFSLLILALQGFFVNY